MIKLLTRSDCQLLACRFLLIEFKKEFMHQQAWMHAEKKILVNKSRWDVICCYDISAFNPWISGDDLALH